MQPRGASDRHPAEDKTEQTGERCEPCRVHRWSYLVELYHISQPPSHRLKFLDDSLGFNFFGVFHASDSPVRFQQRLSGRIGQIGDGKKNALGAFGGKEMVRDDADAFDAGRVERAVRKLLGEGEDRAEQFRWPGGLGQYIGDFFDQSRQDEKEFG